MSTAFIQKNIRLSLEFDTYASRNPGVYDKIPNGSWVVLTVRGDEKFNRESRSTVGIAQINKAKVIEARKEGSRWKIAKFVTA